MLTQTAMNQSFVKQPQSSEWLQSLDKTKQKKAYNSLPIKHKLEIINLVENLPPDKKTKDIAAEFGIPASILSNILKSKETLRSHHTIGSFNKVNIEPPYDLLARLDSELFINYTHTCVVKH